MKRAIGLWLWEFIEKTPVKDSEAINQFFLEYDYLEEIELPDMYFVLNRTRKCIENEEVLTFSKKKNLLEKEPS
jgi:hypothetical protein